MNQRFAFSLVCLVAVALCATACGSKDLPKSAGGGDYAGPTGAVPGGPCTAGTTAECSIELGSHDGVLDCALGTRTCVSGAWGACAANGTSYQVPAPTTKSGMGERELAVGGAATSCVDNPCDPYCNKFDDKPDQPITQPPTVTVTASSGGSLSTSNVPPAFQSKGSLDAQCTSPCTDKSCMEACQYDQHCGTKSNGSSGCVAFAPGENGACTGIDITAPVTCIPEPGYRNITVCNRGSVTAPFGIPCFAFPGGSPQYPEDAPSLRQATLIMTTQASLAPGTCETQKIAESVFPNSGIESMMCNPPGYGVGGVVTETSAGQRYPTANATITWTDPTNGYAADGQYASATTTQSSTTPRLPTAATGVSGWTNTSGAFSVGGQSATATPPTSGGTFPNFPTSNTLSPTSSWSNPTRAYAANETDPTLRYATATPALPALPAVATTAAKYPISNTGNSCNNGAACLWQNAVNAYAKESPPASSPSYATASLSQTNTSVDSNAIYFGYDFSAIPAGSVITSATISVNWKGNAKIAEAKVQAYTAGGTTPISGATITHTGDGSSSPWGQPNGVVQSVTATFATGAVTLADLNDPKFIKLTATHTNNSSVDVLYVDYITVAVSYQAPATPNTSTATFGTFGFSVPAGATITDLKSEVKWKVSAANSNVTLGLQAYTGTTPIGSEQTATATAALTSDTALTYTYPASVVATLTPASLADGALTLAVRATRARPAEDPTNPDVTVSVDYVKFTLTWVFGATASVATFENFGISVPAGVTVTGVTTEVGWNVSVANTNLTLGLQPYTSGGAVRIGDELANAAGTSPPTSFTVQSINATTKSDGSPLSAADFADGTFKVGLRATRAPNVLNNPDVTAYVDYVRVSVGYTAPPTRTVDYSAFGFAVPTARDLMKVSAEVKWRVSAANPNATLGFQAFKDYGATLIGSELVTSPGVSPPTTDTVVTSALDLSQILPADLNSPGFGVRVRSTRGSGLNPNPDYSALVDYVAVSASYGTPTGGNLAECNPYNNWSSVKRVPDPDSCIDQKITKYPPFTVTRVFDAVCPSGTSPKWRNFGYQSIEAGDSRIDFRFRSFDSSGSPASCVQLPAVTSGSPAPLATATATPDTQNCLLSGGTSGCPVDLSTKLGSDARLECLQMDAQATPASDGSGTATLIDWQLTYDCVPSV